MDATQNPEFGNSLEVGFVVEPRPGTPARAGKESNIFSRAFRYLTEDGRNPGKVALLLLQDGDAERVVGAFTETTNGSLCFFPDFNNQLKWQFTRKKGKLKASAMPEFDHFTLNGDFSKRGHLTDPKNPRHIAKHDPAPLAVDVFGWLTITITNTEDLNDFSGELRTKFPITHRSSEEYISIIRESFGGVIKISFPKQPHPDCFGCLQFLLVKKGWKELPQMFYEDPLKKSGLIEDMEDIGGAFANSFLYKTSSTFGYDVLIRAFNVDGKPKNNLYVISSTLNVDNPGH